MLQINHVVGLKKITFPSFPLFSEWGNRVIETEEFKAKIFKVSISVLRMISPIWSLVMKEWAVDVSSEGTAGTTQSGHVILQKMTCSLVRASQGADGRIRAKLRSPDAMGRTPCTPIVSTLQLLGDAPFFNMGTKYSSLKASGRDNSHLYICTVCSLSFYL